MKRSHARVWMMGLAGLLIVQAGCTVPDFFTLPGGATPAAPSVPTLAPRAASSGELAPSQALQANLTVAQSLDKKGDDSGAIQQYEKVLLLDPGNLKVARRLTVLYDHVGQFDKADVQYQKLAKAQPKNADLFNDWGYSYYLRGNEAGFKEAEKQLRRSLELDAKNVKARCNLGLVLGQLGRYQDAFQAFRDAKLSEAEAHCNIGFIYCCQGKLKDARREYQLAQEKDPTLAKAQKMLADLDHPKRHAQDAKSGLAMKPANPLPGGALDNADPSTTDADTSAKATYEERRAREAEIALRAGGKAWIPVSSASDHHAPPAAGEPGVGSVDVEP